MLLALIVFPANVLAVTTKTWTNTAHFEAPLLREGNFAYLITKPRPSVVIKRHLPTHRLKPQKRDLRWVSYQDAKYPRVAVVIGPGKAKNEYGAACVPYARAAGFTISGNANQWPKNAQAAGYRVNHTPAVGAIIVTSESSARTVTGHVTGPIRKITADNYGYLCEQNYKAGMETCGYIALNSPRIVAFIHR